MLSFEGTLAALVGMNGSYVTITAGPPPAMTMSGTLSGGVELVAPFGPHESYFLMLAELPGAGVLLRWDVFVAGEQTEDGIEMRFDGGLVVTVEREPE